MTVYESSYPARMGHPLHIHHDASESFYMLEGTCKFLVGADTFTASEGSFLSVPVGISDEAARALVFMLPAGLEEAFAEPERFDEVFKRRHVKVVGPPLSL